MSIADNFLFALSQSLKLVEERGVFIKDGCRPNNEACAFAPSQAKTPIMDVKNWGRRFRGSQTPRILPRTNKTVKSGKTTLSGSSALLLPEDIC